MKKTNTQIAEHFNWGADCDGWFLVNNANISILQEKMPPGTTEKKHYHKKSWQFFYILSGTALMEIDNKQHQLNTGDGIQIPAQAPHKITNHAKEDLVFLVISSPNHKSDRVNIEND
jgi:mannose-6-phosphate isomerase-like protein (cupin superfamily)